MMLTVDYRYNFIRVREQQRAEEKEKQFLASMQELANKRVTWNDEDEYEDWMKSPSCVPKICD